MKKMRNGFLFENENDATFLHCPLCKAILAYYTAEDIIFTDFCDHYRAKQVSKEETGLYRKNGEVVNVIRMRNFSLIVEKRCLHEHEDWFEGPAPCDV